MARGLGWAGHQGRDGGLGQDLSQNQDQDQGRCADRSWVGCQGRGLGLGRGQDWAGHRGQVHEEVRDLVVPPVQGRGLGWADRLVRRSAVQGQGQTDLEADPVQALADHETPTRGLHELAADRGWAALGWCWCSG